MMLNNITTEEIDFDPFEEEQALSQVVFSTKAQREIWSLSQISSAASCAFNQSISLELEGPLHHQALSSALNYLLQRHDALRTTFNSDGHCLCVAESSSVVAKETSANQSDLNSVIEKEANSIFDLQKGPLIRFTKINRENDKTWLVISAHEIICDSWSLKIIVNDLSQAYTNFLLKDDFSSPKAYPFVHFANQCLTNDDEAKNIEYWAAVHKNNQFSPFFQGKTELSEVKTFDSEKLDFILPDALIPGLKKMAVEETVSLTAIMLAAFYTCFYRWSGEKDLVIGLPLAKQSDYASTSLVGLCSNLLPVRLKINETNTITGLIKEIDSLLLSGAEHSSFNYSMLLEKLDITDTSSFTSICPVSFNVEQGIQNSAFKFQGLKVNLHANRRLYNNFEVSLNLLDYNGKNTLVCQYNSSLQNASTMQNRLQEYCNVLHQFLDCETNNVNEIQLLSTSQRQDLVLSHSNTIAFDEHNQLIKMFDVQAVKSPDAIAIQCGDTALSYGELHNGSNQIATTLIEQGVLPGNLVGVCLDRNVDLLKILLGIMKAGAGYVPLDPEYPIDRLNFMLEDSNLQFLISQNEYFSRLTSVENSFVIQKLLQYSASKSVETPQINVLPGSICYVIYTSGSTGKPKGVKVSHDNVSNFLQGMAVSPGLKATDSLLAVTTLSFDIAVLELYLPLICGAKVVLATKDQVVDGSKLKELLEAHSITVMQATPATWRLLCSSGWQGHKSLKILCGGETLAQDLCKDLLSRCGELWNMYGPTETTVWSTCAKISSDSAQPTIGKAVANTQLFVLDEYYNLQPDGIPGELYIAGQGVSLGYLKRDSLTQQRFMKLSVANNRIAYRTGDRVCFNSAGELEYLGRLDSQIKLRGFRIELGEIESTLRLHDSIQECALAVQGESPDDERLVAFLVADEQNKGIDFNEIRNFLLLSLPIYMIPQHYMLMESLPSTPNGKLDRRVLPAFDFSNLSNQTLDKVIAEASTDTERSLSLIWQKELKIDTISIEDNFFDLGGHSLLIAKVIQNIQEKHSVHLQYRDVFTHSTIESLARFIDCKADKDNTLEYSPVVSRGEQKSFSLSMIQNRFWYLDKLQPGSIQFNLPSAFKFTGKLDVSALETALKQIIQRHQSLRTSIAETNGEPSQIIAENIDFSLMITDLPEADQQYEMLRQKVEQLRCSVFDISQGPLFICELIRLNENENILFFMPHHIISDGWSLGVFIHEISVLYGQNTGFDVAPLTDLPFQYGDYSLWLSDFVSSEVIHSQVEYWRVKLAGTLPILEIPTDYKRPEIIGTNAAETYFLIDESLFTLVEEMTKTKGVSVFMVLMSAYVALLHRFTGQTDLMVGTLVADRTRAGTESLIGCFINTLALRFNVEADSSFDALLTQVKETCLSGLANSDVPFETLIEEFNNKREFSHSPLFQTSINYQDESSFENSMGDIEIQQLDIPAIEPALDINIWFKRRDTQLQGAVAYNTDLFHADTIQNFIDSLHNILHSIVNSEEQTISNLEILSKNDSEVLIALNNETQQNWDSTISVHEMFERQAVIAPDSIAVICESSEVSYFELSQRSNQLAHYLIEHGVQPGQVIGLCLDRNVDMMVSLLAILKAGCAFVALDSEFPLTRLNYIVDDADVEWLITQQKHSGSLPQVNNIILTDELSALLEDTSTSRVDADISDHSTAYIVYTSGSTGNPKGVVVQHASVVNFLESMWVKPGIDDGDRLLAVTTLSFDISVLELFLPLISGATTVIASKQDVIDGRRLFELVKERGITFMQATPSTWRMLIAAGWDEEYKLKALCGGEALPADLAKQLLMRTKVLWNMYGPSETTIWSSCDLIIDSNLPISIGKPIANTHFYLLDENMNLVPEGVIGELYISGAGVSAGYLKDPGKNKSSYLDNPFDNSSALYRTGDKVRYRIDGSLEYIGRIDEQVKVRGYRIELGEIESALRESDNIKDCIVTVLDEEHGDTRLVAYIIWTSQALTMTEIREHCRNWLPSYMIPQHVVEIETIPKTLNGKVDRKSLPKPFTNLNQQDTYVAPKTQEEIWLAKVWQEVLNIEKIGNYDNFFDLGGHSLLSMQVVFQIEKTYDVTINPRELLLDTLEQIATKFTIAGSESKRKITLNNAVQEAPKRGFFSRLFGS